MRIRENVRRGFNMIFKDISPPAFSIQNAPAIFYIYLQNGNVSFISHKNDENGDEIIKVGRVDDKFTFYPTKEDSIYFGDKFEIRTSRLIESILSNKLNLIASKIYGDMEFFLDKIMEYEALYKAKLENMEIRLDLSDKTNILNKRLLRECRDKMMERLQNLAKTNIKDSFLNIFATMYPNGIDDIESLITQKTLLRAEMLRNYYNKSNLANKNLVEKILINGDTLSVNYRIKSMHLFQAKQIYADSKVVVDSIDVADVLADEMIGGILYSNNEIKITINKNSFTIKNLTSKNIKVEGIRSVFCANDSTKPFIEGVYQCKWLAANDEMNVNINFIKKGIANLTANNIAQCSIIHTIKLHYTIDDTAKNLVGKSRYKLRDMLSL